MVKHPQIEWLYQLYDDVHDAERKRDRLDDVRESLHFYIPLTEHFFYVADTLNVCFDDLMGQGHYTSVIELYQMLINVFDSDLPLYDVRENYSTPIGKNNAERFPSEYFTIKLNYAHAVLMRHSLAEVQQHLCDIQDLIPTVGYEFQLKAYYLFLKYISFDHQTEIEPNIIGKIEDLLRNNSYLKLEAYIAIAYYHYNKGDLVGMEQIIRKINKALGQSRSIYPEKISKVTAEQYMYLAIMYRDMKQYDKALEYFEIALDQTGRIDHSVYNMLILSEKALVYAFKDDIKEAKYWIDRAFQRFRNLPESQGYLEARIEHIQGLIAYNDSDFETALFSFQRVLPIWEAYQREYHIALANNAIGATLIKLNRPEEAIAYLNQAKVVCKPLNDKQYADELLGIIDINLNNAQDMLSK